MVENGLTNEDSDDERRRNDCTKEAMSDDYEREQDGWNGLLYIASKSDFESEEGGLGLRLEGLCSEVVV